MGTTLEQARREPIALVLAAAPVAQRLDPSGSAPSFVVTVATVRPPKRCGVDPGEDPPEQPAACSTRSNRSLIRTGTPAELPDLPSWIGTTAATLPAQSSPATCDRHCPPAAHCRAHSPAHRRASKRQVDGIEAMYICPPKMRPEVQVLPGPPALGERLVAEQRPIDVGEDPSLVSQAFCQGPQVGCRGGWRS